VSGRCRLARPSAFLFQSANQKRSLAREVQGTLQVAVRKRAFRLGEKRSRVFEHPAILRRGDLAFELCGPLAETFLEVLDLLAECGLLPGGFARFERGDLGGGLLFGLRSGFGCGWSLAPNGWAAPRYGFRGGRFPRSGLSNLGRRGFLDDDRFTRFTGRAGR